MKTVLFSSTLLGWTAATTVALAAGNYATTIDVNIRSGPGANYPIVEVLHAGETIASQKCDAGWCSVTAPGGAAGWIALRFLSPKGPAASDPATTTARVTAATGTPATSSGLIDTTTTAAVPTVGAPVSLALPETARKYVTTHRPLSIELGGEPKVGGMIPTNVRLRDIPGSRYRYVYVDGHPVFVDGETRQIVQVEQ